MISSTTIDSRSSRSTSGCLPTVSVNSSHHWDILSPVLVVGCREKKQKGRHPMSRPSLTLEQMLTLLRETPTRIAELTADLSPEALQMKPAPDEWSANEVLAHLRACADVWG